MLVGLILGDAYVERSGEKSFITVEHTVKHKGYLSHLYETLSAAGVNLFGLKHYSRSDKRYNVINESVYFKSHNTALLNFLADTFISVEGNKILALDIKTGLSPIALTYWICDDGQLVKNGGITLCTHNFTLIEVEILIEALTKNFGAKCSIHIKKARSGNIYHRIYIGKSSFDKIKPLISNVHKDFLYKLHS